MTIEELLRNSRLPAIDAELLAAHILGKNRTWIAAHINEELADLDRSQLESILIRRCEGEPLAYITGEKEFFGRVFHITHDTLIPRPATELLVEQAIKLLAGETIDPVLNIDTEIIAWSQIKEDLSNVQLVVDVGTGSGCIAITIACERPDVQCIATDISREALEIAQKNASTHRVEDRIVFHKGRGLAAAELITEPFLIISNPPYIPTNAVLDRNVIDYEPSFALFAGNEGTDVLYPLLTEAMAHPLCRGFIVECREEQKIDINKMIQ